jgi:SAM-dependent methyltransferase
MRWRSKPAVSDEVNPGWRLRSQSIAQGGTSAIFSRKVADYLASRPGYPAALFDTLHETANLVRGAAIADLGAGTGLLTRALLERGYSVIAVEPNAPMREAADKFCGGFPGYRSVFGIAEAMPLADRSVDLITAAQAFHWFDVEPAQRECLRILKPGGKVALIWNDRLNQDPLHTALDEVFARFGGVKREALLANENHAQARHFFGGPFQEFTWPNEQTLDEFSLQSLVFSRSYMPNRETEAGAAVVQELRRVFENFATAGRVAVRYRTIAMIGSLAV